MRSSALLEDPVFFHQQNRHNFQWQISLNHPSETFSFFPPLATRNRMNSVEGRFYYLQFRDREFPSIDGLHELVEETCCVCLCVCKGRRSKINKRAKLCSDTTSVANVLESLYMLRRWVVSRLSYKPHSILEPMLTSLSLFVFPLGAN